MKISVFRKAGIHLFSDEWEFTFHGIKLAEGVGQFMYEKSELMAKNKYENTILYIPFSDIFEIEVKE